MVAAFERVSTQTGLPMPRRSSRVWPEVVSITPYEALIVASLIEAEAKVPEDRAKIARVIYNRLAEGMTLGIDATVALRPRRTHRPAHPEATSTIDSPYNTRQVDGPAADARSTPRGRPRSRRRSTRRTATGSTTCSPTTDGHHYFTDSYADFQRAVKDAQDRGVF